eukprot:scaffold12080_cov67-Phaeocystis_antarctica.AAC.6
MTGRAGDAWRYAERAVYTPLRHSRPIGRPRLTVQGRAFLCLSVCLPHRHTPPGVHTRGHARRTGGARSTPRPGSRVRLVVVLAVFCECACHELILETPTKSRTRRLIRGHRIVHFHVLNVPRAFGVEHILPHALRAAHVLA